MSRVLGQWELRERLARSLSGEVWLARDTDPSAPPEPMAVKLIAPELAKNAAFLRPFLEDARIATGLRHPNLVQVHDLCRVDGEVFVVTELVEGESLADIIEVLSARGEPIRPGLAASLVASACAALHHAHTSADATGRALGLAHRGLRPSNVMVTYDGQVKVTDFGVTAATARVPELRARLPVRRFAYASPEQCLDTTVDARSDVFSLGVLLWELVVGAPLFEGDSELAVKQAVCQQPVLLPSQRREGVPAELDAIVLRALAKDAAARYANCLEMQGALEAFVVHTREPTDAATVGAFMKALFPSRLAAWRRRLGVRVRGAGTSPHSLLTPAQLAAVTEAPDEDALEALLSPAPRPLEPTLPFGARGAPPRLPEGAGGALQVPPQLPEDAAEAPIELELSGAEDLVPAGPAAVPPPVPADAPEPRGEGALEDEEAFLWDPSGSVWGRDEVPDVGAPGPMVQPIDMAAPRPHAEAVWPPPERPESLSADERLAAERARRQAREQEQLAALLGSPKPPTARQRRTASMTWDRPIDGAEPDIFAEEDEDGLYAVRQLFDIESAIAMPAAAPLTRRWQLRTSANGPPVADVIRWRNDAVLESAYLQRAFDSFGRKGGPIFVRMGIGRARVRMGPKAKGWVNRHGTHPDAREPLEPLKTVVLGTGDRARVDVGEDRYVVRVLASELMPRPRRRALALKALGIAAGLSLLMHLVGGLGVAALDQLGVQVSVEAPPAPEKFAEVRMQKVRTLRKMPELEPEPVKEVARKPKPPKPLRVSKIKPPPPPEPVAPPPAPESVQTTPPRLSAAARRKVEQQLGEKTAGKTRSEQVKTLFDRQVQPGAAASVAEAMANVQATKAKGATDALQVAAGVGGDTDKVRLEVGGGEAPVTVSGSSATKEAGKLERRAKPAEVRGTVQGLRALAKVSGELSKSEVLKVIGAHGRAFNRCYEKELMTSPGLSGKITFQWTITPDGKVSGASQQTSTMSNTAVANCVLGILRGLKFPKPTGGSVQVVYPFIFRSSQ
ncbi:MAG: serine/threonine protein kinase [Deltaproteobacteria bacterium]|nr:serine/threonine protein kinase [Deltaproteobacteria bacterium]MCB9786081.1 serine/threonine protein kinase [Deltaproteobacteria bacterium]